MMNVKLTSLIRVIVVVLVIMDYSFFSLIEIPGILYRFWSPYSKFLPGMISFLLCMIVLTKNLTYSSSFFLNNYLCSLVVSILILSVYTLFTHGSESIMTQLLENSMFFYAALAIPLHYTFQKDKTMDRMLNLINKLMLFMYLLLLIQHIIYAAGGELFLKVNESVRNSNIRLSLGSLGNFFILYNFDKVYNREEGDNIIFNIIQLILGLYMLVAVQQTRGFTFAVVLSLAVMILVSSEKQMQSIQNMVLLGVVTFILIQSGAIEQFFSSLKVNLDTGDTTLVRLNAIEYYLGEFLKNPLFGHGIITEANPISRGPLGIYHYTDVGVFAGLARYGLFMIPIYLWPIWRLGKLAIHMLRKRRLRKRNALIFGLLVYLLGTSISLSILDVFRIFLLPFVLAIIAYTEREVCYET